jgi:CheY-like chemotaxis protein
MRQDWVIVKSVLIVEDEIFVAMDIERILVDAGYNVVAIAADQQEALAAAGQAELAFVDLNLRDGPTGPEIARDLAHRFGVRVVYVTANPAQIGEPALHAIGCIRKPFSEPAILAAAGLASAAIGPALIHEDIIRL